MRRFLAVGSLLLLTACNAGKAVSYDLRFNTQDPGRLTLLSLSVTRVIERRVQSLGATASHIDISQRAEGPRLSFSIDPTEAADALETELTAPFTLRIMREAKPGETGDLTIEGHGGFKDTGVTQEHLEWAEATEEPDNKGRITLKFTEDGRTRMQKVFKENVGKSIGLFVRDRLVAKLQVDTAEVKDEIIISGIPSMDLARVFSDDVNVGLHVMFVPVE